MVQLFGQGFPNCFQLRRWWHPLGPRYCTNVFFDWFWSRFIRIIRRKWNDLSIHLSSASVVHGLGLGSVIGYGNTIIPIFDKFRNISNPISNMAFTQWIPNWLFLSDLFKKHEITSRTYVAAVICILGSLVGPIYLTPVSVSILLYNTSPVIK